MYFWKIKDLKKEIQDGNVVSTDNVLYLSLFSLLYFTLLIQSLIQIHNLWNMEMVIVQLLISILGV
ncbi:MAG: Unknown protein, partial [uncultured Sulfurovum sp.]